MWLFSRKLTNDTTAVSDKFLEEHRKVLVYQEEAKRIANLTLQYTDIETGGSLFGYWMHSGSPIISFASGPGLHSRHNPTSFYQDETYLLNLGTELYDQHGLQHIGEWHSHHRLGLNEPSQGDINTIFSGMRQKGWLHFLLLITTIENFKEGMVLANYFLFSENRTTPDPLRILTLPGSSPFRTPEHLTREEPIRSVPKMSWRPGPFTPGARRLAQEVFPDAWFTSIDGKDRLAKIAHEFRDAGVECRMVPCKEGQEIQLLIGEDILILDREFPNKAPEWFGMNKPENIDEWSSSTDLVKWYFSAINASYKGNKD